MKYRMKEAKKSLDRTNFTVGFVVTFLRKIVCVTGKEVPDAKPLPTARKAKVDGDTD